MGRACSNAVMENLPRRAHAWADKHFSVVYEKFGQDGSTFPNSRLIILGLGLLNAVLLIAAVAIGINCAKVKEGSPQASHSAATQLINELSYLRSNHSDVMEAAEEAKRALGSALKKHAQLKVQIEQQKNRSDGYQRQLQALRAERTRLQSNVSALEGSCGRCLPRWTLLNSSCYFFSYFEPNMVQKNWADGRADCVSRGADLVVIDNPEEQEFVSDIVRNFMGDSHQWAKGSWIGITDSLTEGTWVWINNVTEVEQRYWMDGEPNNSGAHGEDCGIVIYSSSNPWKTWFDGKCQTHKLHWICEMAST